MTRHLRLVSPPPLTPAEVEHQRLIAAVAERLDGWHLQMVVSVTDADGVEIIGDPALSPARAFAVRAEALDHVPTGVGERVPPLKPAPRGRVRVLDNALRRLVRDSRLAAVGVSDPVPREVWLADPDVFRRCEAEAVHDLLAVVQDRRTRNGRNNRGGGV